MACLHCPTTSLSILASAVAGFTISPQTCYSLHSCLRRKLPSRQLSRRRQFHNSAPINRSASEWYRIKRAELENGSKQAEADSEGSTDADKAEAIAIDPSLTRAQLNASLGYGKASLSDELMAEIKRRRNGEPPKDYPPAIAQLVEAGIKCSENAREAKKQKRRDRRAAIREDGSIGDALAESKSPPLADAQPRMTPKRFAKAVWTSLPDGDEDELREFAAKNLPGTKATTSPRIKPNSQREPWQVQKEGLQQKLQGEHWNPRKRISPDAMDGIRALHKSDPERYSTEALSKQFEVSPDAIRRILRSKWQPTPEVAEDRRERWEKRGERIWNAQVEMGVRPPKKWRDMGIGKAKPGQAPLWKRHGKPSPLDHVPWDNGSTEVQRAPTVGPRRAFVSDQLL